VVKIQAIETTYNGYRFRSRLEARWAVFFDAIGQEYEYEPEGFELMSGRYLPDFCFGRDSKYPQWVEVKPPGETELDPRWLEFTKLRGSPPSITTDYLTVFSGDPVDCKVFTSAWGNTWLRGFWCDTLEPFSSTYSIDTQEGLVVRLPLVVGDWTAFAAAKVKARQARFEFGETPE